MNPLKTIILTAAAGAVLAAAVASYAPPVTKASVSLTVIPQMRQETADYAYDGYYAIRAAELVSDTLIGWIATPSAIKEILIAESGSFNEADAMTGAGRMFRARKLSPQNVVVTFSAMDESAAARRAEAVTQVLSTRASGLAVSAEGDPLFHVAAAAPVVAKVPRSLAAAAAAGLLIGAFLGFALAYLGRMKKNPQP